MAIIYIPIGNYTHPTRFVSANYRCDFVHIISATNYGSSKQIRVHSALRMIKRVNLLATRRWSGKFVVDGVKQGTKLIDRALIITRCHGHYSKGIERPLYWTSGSLSIFSRISTIIVLYYTHKYKRTKRWIRFIRKLKLYTTQEMHVYIFGNLKRLFKV